VKVNFMQKKNVGFTPLENWGNIPTQDLHKINSGRSGEKKSRFLTGFTLIELLIVVAIIAILAAIAIPNYLAAQTRSKVSKAKSEMRTLGTALESYFTDNNVYPPDYVTGTWTVPGWPYYVSNVVTTPITYITSNKLNDPFAIVNAGVGASLDYIGRRYRYVNWGVSGYHAVYPTGTEGDGMWRLWSVAPDGRPATSSNEYYDPSNGTISNGDIYRTQKYGVGRAGFVQ
jgi:prepilin-type N-terminal cleavage/methylation domain-containing protein